MALTIAGANHTVVTRDRSPSADSAAIEPAEPEPAPTESVLYELDERVLEEVRMALRGRTTEELLTHLDAEEGALDAAVARLTKTGALVWRGRKLYLP